MPKPPESAPGSFFDAEESSATPYFDAGLNVIPLTGDNTIITGDDASITGDQTEYYVLGDWKIPAESYFNPSRDYGEE